MKFACDSCDTKYVIPDERVAGKVLHIRCKRCSQIMEVGSALTPRAQTRSVKVNPRQQDVARDEPMFSTKRSGAWDPFVAAGGSGHFSLGSGMVRMGGQTGGGMQSGVATTPPPAPHVTVEMWHVAIRGKARGPFTRDELEVLAARGTIRVRSWVWRPGLDRWTRLQEVAELANIERVISQRVSTVPPAIEGATSDGDSLTVSKDWPPRPVEGLAPQKPFANLVNSHAEWALPPQTPADTTMELPVRTSTGGTGWYALDAAALAELLQDESSGRYVPGTSPMVTGVHLLNRPVRRIAIAVAGASTLLFVVLALLAIPELIEMRTAKHNWINTPERIPVRGDVVDPASVTPSAEVFSMARRPAPVVTPSNTPAKPNLDAMTNAMGDAAQGKAR